MYQSPKNYSRWFLYLVPISLMAQPYCSSPLLRSRTVKKEKHKMIVFSSGWKLSSILFFQICVLFLTVAAREKRKRNQDFLLRPRCWAVWLLLKSDATFKWETTLHVILPFYLSKPGQFKGYAWPGPDCTPNTHPLVLCAAPYARQ